MTATQTMIELKQKAETPIEAATRERRTARCRLRDKLVASNGRLACLNWCLVSDDAPDGCKRWAVGKLLWSHHVRPEEKNPQSDWLGEDDLPTTDLSRMFWHSTRESAQAARRHIEALENKHFAVRPWNRFCHDDVTKWVEDRVLSRESNEVGTVLLTDMPGDDEEACIPGPYFIHRFGWNDIGDFYAHVRLHQTRQISDRSFALEYEFEALRR